MRVTSLLLAFVAIAGPSMAPAATAPDLAIFNVIRQTDLTLVSDRIVYRSVVAPDLDLVIAIGSTAEWAAGSDSTNLWWDENRKLGLFLQEKARPDRVYLLTLNAGLPDCGARIERATSTDTVISCTGEKGAQGMNQKFVYDVRAKSLVSHFAYQPVAMRPAFNVSGRTVFVGNDLTDVTKRVAVEFQAGRPSELQILDKGGAAPWLARAGQALYLDDPTPIHFGETDAFTFVRGYMDEHGKEYPSSISDSEGKKYPLPQSTNNDFVKARPGLIAEGFSREGAIIEESIGTVQIEGEKLWFGKTFYDGEGYTGVGGFGYFDATDHQYHMVALPEVADFSISPIRVEPDTVWMAIYHAGEWGDSPAGVLRYDRVTHAVRKYDLPDDVNGFVTSGNRLLVYTSSGIAIMDGDQINRYFVDRTTDGRLRITQATR